MLLATARAGEGRIGEAQSALARALELDADVAGGKSTLAILKMLSWEFDAASDAAEHAYRLGERGAYPPALLRAGQLARAVDVAFEDLLASPLDPMVRNLHHKAVFLARRYVQSLEVADRVRASQPNYTDDFEEAALLKLGRFSDAHRAALAHLENACGTPCDPGREAAAAGWHEGGLEAAIRARLATAIEIGLPETRRQVPGGSAVMVAVDYASLGEIDLAFEWLEMGFRTRDVHMYAMGIFPQLDVLRLDPRFDDLLERMGFPDADSPEKNGDLGQVLALQGRSVEATARLNRAIQARPTHESRSRWEYHRALAHFAAGNDDAAIRAANVAQALAKTGHQIALVRLLIAASHAHAGRTEEASGVVDAVREAWPEISIDLDLAPMFLAGDRALADRYARGLRLAGLAGEGGTTISE